MSRTKPDKLTACPEWVDRGINKKALTNKRKCLIVSVIPVGFEPTTAFLEGRCSIQLSYGTNKKVGSLQQQWAELKNCKLLLQTANFYCRGGRIRTYDLLLPKQARYRATLHPETNYTAKILKRQKTNKFKVAERAGFEPAVPLRVRQFSKLLVSATHPSLHSADNRPFPFD
jgi:hypothetical protein